MQSVVVVNAKIDSKTQQRRQCSLRFDNMFKHLAPGGNREAQEQPGLGGFASPITVASRPGEFTR